MSQKALCSEIRSPVSNPPVRNVVIQLHSEASILPFSSRRPVWIFRKHVNMKSTTVAISNWILCSAMQRGFCFILLLLTCFGLLPRAQAVTPAPDGGYPGGNTAEGTDALFGLSSGVWDTALGAQALNHNTIGVANTATGFQSLFYNTTGGQNTA